MSNYFGTYYFDVPTKTKPLITSILEDVKAAYNIKQADYNYIDPDGNNILMLYLNIFTDRQACMDKKIKFKMDEWVELLPKYDLNHKNNFNERLVDILLESNYFFVHLDNMFPILNTLSVSDLANKKTFKNFVDNDNLDEYLKYRKKSINHDLIKDYFESQILPNGAKEIVKFLIKYNQLINDKIFNINYLDKIFKKYPITTTTTNDQCNLFNIVMTCFSDVPIKQLQTLLNHWNFSIQDSHGRSLLHNHIRDLSDWSTAEYPDDTWDYLITKAPINNKTIKFLNHIAAEQMDFGISGQHLIKIYEKYTKSPDFNIETLKDILSLDKDIVLGYNLNESDILQLISLTPIKLLNQLKPKTILHYLIDMKYNKGYDMHWNNKDLIDIINKVGVKNSNLNYYASGSREYLFLKSLIESSILHNDLNQNKKRPPKLKNKL